MEAVGLIEETRQALARSAAAAGTSGVADVIAEVWQVQALVEAVGSHLAITGPPAVRAEAASLSEAGMRGCVTLRHDGQGAEGVRAARLTRMDDVHAALGALAVLLGESITALVGVCVSAEEEGLYWQCVEAIDAADVSADRVTGILRGLALPERGPAA
ncbi:DUF6099 family protein [Streptomyces sp. DSM 42041]|uniref:DUF6099 family protein n=1 Tax=Streptomyces hazeniae TaxID=3075538 RepID=A0ABU2NMQ4_9ACTN|nr:DUF6099 family protein [Streptomyces sp. DSM 42041]MDT0378252.1 DUF6099 family protein [Streptomyces sp. DSM 42041]